MSRAARAAGWVAVGYLAAFAMALAGSKLHGLFIRTWSIPDVCRWVRARFNRWLTWQGASPDQRYRWLRVKELKHLDGVDRHDWVPTDSEMGTEQ